MIEIDHSGAGREDDIAAQFQPRWGEISPCSPRTFPGVLRRIFRNMHPAEDGEELFCAWGVLLMCLTLAGGEPIGQCHDLHAEFLFFNALPFFLPIFLLLTAMVPTHWGHSGSPLLGYMLMDETVADKGMGIWPLGEFPSQSAKLPYVV